MRRVFKYAFKIFKRIDISPLDSSHLFFKIIIFLVWGINVLFFITKDLISDEVFVSSVCKYKTSTLVIKISPLGLTDNIEFEFYAPLSGAVSSYNISLDVHDFQKIIRDRSPPQDLI
jgi:hypothetical protein